MTILISASGRPRMLRPSSSSATGTVASFSGGIGGAETLRSMDHASAPIARAVTIARRQSRRDGIGLSASRIRHKYNVRRNSTAIAAPEARHHVQVARITTCAYARKPALVSVPTPVTATSAGQAHRKAACVSRKMIATYAATPKNAIGTPISTELGCDAIVAQPLLAPQGTGSFRMCPALRTAAVYNPPKATNNVTTGSQTPRGLTDPISPASGMDAMMERFIINRRWP